MIKLQKLTRKSEKAFQRKCKSNEIAFNLDDFKTEDIEPEISIDENKQFKNKFELGEYLYSILKDIDVSNNIWHFLVIVYHKQLLKNSEIGEIDRFFINDTKGLYPFTRLLKPVFDLYSFYSQEPTLIDFLLLSPVNDSSGLFLEITKRQDIMKNRTFVEVARTIFYDEKKKKNKPSSVDGVKRLIDLFHQYERTYDLYRMPSKYFIKNLLSKHSEFDKFKKGFLNKTFV